MKSRPIFILTETDLRRADLSKAILRGTDLSKADLSEANLSRANLEGANLSEANLSRANLEGANLTWASLAEANLEGAILIQADLREANLSGWPSGANLGRANLVGANLAEANLQRANLQRANLVGAILREVDLKWASLEGANLKWAILKGTDLTYAKALAQEQIEQTIGDETTLLPRDLQRPDQWTMFAKSLQQIQEAAAHGTESDYRQTMRSVKEHIEQPFRDAAGHLHRPSEWWVEELMTSENQTKIGSKQTPASIGEPVTVGDVTLIVTNARQANQLRQQGAPSKFAKTEQGNFVIVDFDFITNTDSYPITLHNYSLTLIDSEGRKSKAGSDYFLYIPEERRIFLERINPGVTQRGQAIFEVAPGAWGFTLRARDATAFTNKNGYVDLGF
jgi:hypothetical protein